jgi:hypothetical protein
MPDDMVEMKELPLRLASPGFHAVILSPLDAPSVLS